MYICMCVTSHILQYTLQHTYLYNNNCVSTVNVSYKKHSTQNESLPEDITVEQLQLDYMLCMKVQYIYSVHVM